MNFEFDFKTSPRIKSERDDPYALITGDIVSLELTSDVPFVTTNLPTTGAMAYYKIIGELSSEESFGYSYAAFKCNSNHEPIDTKPFFIKTPRIKKALQLWEIRDILQKVESTFQREYDNREIILELNDTLKVAANIEAFGEYRRRVQGHNRLELRIPYLVQEYINELSLERFFTSEPYRSEYSDFLRDDRFTGISDPVLWFQLAGRIIDIVRRVHNRQIIHGELVPKNILMSTGEGTINPILVDFGQSFQIDVAAVEGTRAKGTSRYLAPECREPNIRFYTPADIYSLGGVLYFLATGTPPPDIHESQDIFPTVISWANANQKQTDLWKSLIHEGFRRNAGLMRRNEGIVKIIDKCMRPRPSDRYPSAEKVLQALNAVNYKARRVMDIRSDIQEVAKEWDSIEQRNEETHRKWADVFINIVGDKLELLLKEMADMDKGHYEIFGEREDIIDTLIKYIGVLKPGDTYVTVTVPEYWTEENLGINGRFLTVNKDLVRNGVFVNRLFLVTEEDLRSEPSRRILKAHLDAWDSLDEENRTPIPIFPVHPNNKQVTEGKMFVGVRTDLSKEEIREFQQDVNHVAIWSNAKTGEKMSLIFVLRPIYDEKDGDLVQTGSQVVKVRFRALSGTYEYDQLVEMFGDNKAKPLFSIAEKLHDNSSEEGLSI